MSELGAGMTPGRVVMFSRDARTHGLFRAAWTRAVEVAGLTQSVHLRGSGLSGALRYLRDFVGARQALRLIFGVAEIVLLAPVARAGDVFVVAGLGRLLQRENWRARLIRAHLRLFDRGQRVVALNLDDQAFLRTIFKGEVSLLHGEGYHFEPLPSRSESAEGFRMAYAGRLLKSKGVDVLIDAFQQLPGEFTLTLMGDLDFGNSDAVDAEWLKDRIARSDGRIRHLGFLDNVRAQLASADIYISLSDREGLPFGVLDGINAGCVVILSDVPGHREFAGLPGVHFVATDPAQVAGCLARIRANPDDYLRFDSRTRLAACDAKFGFEVIVACIRAMLFGGWPDADRK